MARCGCAGSGCSCVIQQGDNVVVTGTGTPDDPYIVSAVTGATVDSGDDDQAYYLDDYFVPNFQPITNFASGVSGDSSTWPPAFWVKPNGEVILRGILKKTTGYFSGDSGDTIATLPASCSPGKYATFAPATNFSNSLNLNTRMVIHSDGTIKVSCQAGVVNSIALDNISYFMGA